MRGRGVRTLDVAIVIETRAGEVAQVAFGYLGKLYDSSSGRLFFVMVLGFRRWVFARLCFDQM